MEGGWEDPIGVDPWSPEQQVVGHVSIDHVTCDLYLQVPDLTSKTDLPQRVITSGVKSIDGSSHY